MMADEKEKTLGEKEKKKDDKKKAGDSLTLIGGLIEGVDRSYQAGWRTADMHSDDRMQLVTPPQSHDETVVHGSDGGDNSHVEVSGHVEDWERGMLIRPTPRHHRTHPITQPEIREGLS